MKEKIVLPRAKFLFNGKSAQKIAFFIAIAFFCFQSFSCAKDAQKGNANLPVKTLTIKTANGSDVSLSAEIAATDKTRELGFMFRKNIPDGTGMLFVYQSDSALNFWMKNTPTPLSIAYIDYKGRIKDIFDMQPYNLSGITSTGFVRYALEVPQGWFERVGIKVGDTLELNF